MGEASGQDWSQDTDPVHLLNGWLTVKLGPAWRVEPLKDRAMASTFVCRGLGMPGERFPESALWWLEQCWPPIGGLCRLYRGKGLAGLSQLSLLHFLEASLLLFIIST